MALWIWLRYKITSLVISQFPNFRGPITDGISQSAEGWYRVAEPAEHSARHCTYCISSGRLLRKWNSSQIEGLTWVTISIYTWNRYREQDLTWVTIFIYTRNRYREQEFLVYIYIYIYIDIVTHVKFYTRVLFQLFFFSVLAPSLGALSTYVCSVYFVRFQCSDLPTRSSKILYFYYL